MHNDVQYVMSINKKDILHYCYETNISFRAISDKINNVDFRHLLNDFNKIVKYRTSIRIVYIPVHTPMDCLV